MSIKKEISELVSNGIIRQEDAERIRAYYNSRSSTQSQNRLFLIFGIFGGLLVGLGIILIIAHNWDNFSKTIKTGLAFFPLIAGQALCLFSLLRRSNSVAWRETSSVILFFAVGASISLISQIYNIPGNLTNYLMVWMLLVLPLIYIMRSSATSLLSLIGITTFAVQSGFGPGFTEKSYLYWLFLAFIVPFYARQIEQVPRSNFTQFLHWFVALSLTISLGAFARSHEEMLWMDYLFLMGILQAFGYWLHHHRNVPEFNGMRIIGSIGTVIVLVILSFDGVWDEMKMSGWTLSSTVLSPEFLIFIFAALLLGILYFKIRKDGFPDKTAIPFWVYIVSILIFLSYFFWNYAAVLINILVLIIGILKIKEGADRDHLIVLNFGMLIIAILIACRFFDTDLSFVLRGILFVIVGAAFFAANYIILKRRKHVDQ